MQTILSKRAFLFRNCVTAAAVDSAAATTAVATATAAIPSLQLFPVVIQEQDGGESVHLRLAGQTEAAEKSRQKFQ